MMLQIIPTALLPDFLRNLPVDLQQAFDRLRDAELSTPNFSFYTSVASVFSSRIEGEEIELDSYIKHKRDGIVFQPDYTKKIDDLYGAYQFAQGNPLTEENVKHAHRLLSKHLISASWQGRYRNQNMYVATEDGKIDYVAAAPHTLTDAMHQFFEDVAVLQKQTLTLGEVFFFASMIHLVFVKIHPWNDGNGRSARLIEKWFLAEKLGEKAWFIQSEKMYYHNHKGYYQNIRALGLEYDYLDYSKAMPFLEMLPKALITI